MESKNISTSPNVLAFFFNADQEALVFSLGRVLTTSVLIVGVLCERSAAQNLPTVPQRDFQLWPDIAVNYDRTPKFTITAFEQLRFGDNVSRFAENLTSPSITYYPSHFVSVGSGYFYRYYNPYLTGAHHENRLYVEGTVSTPRIHGFAISDRLRTELRWEEVADEIDKKFILPGGHGKFAQRYRNRLTLQHPLRISQALMTCFVRWERLYSMSQGWTQTRYYAGFDVPVTERITIQNYYLYISKTDSVQHVKQNVGISFMFDLHRRSRKEHSLLSILTNRPIGNLHMTRIANYRKRLDHEYRWYSLSYVERKRADVARPSVVGFTRTWSLVALGVRRPR